MTEFNGEYFGTMNQHSMDGKTAFLYILDQVNTQPTFFCMLHAGLSSHFSSKTSLLRFDELHLQPHNYI